VRALGLDTRTGERLLGTLAAGAPADLTVFDPAARWRVEAGALRSKGKNTPLLGTELAGRVALTIGGGRVAYRAGEVRVG
jgi:dihydroorotase